MFPDFDETFLAWRASRLFSVDGLAAEPSSPGRPPDRAASLSLPGEVPDPLTIALADWLAQVGPFQVSGSPAL